MTDRSHDLARRLTFWAMVDGKEPSYVDEHVQRFIEASEEKVKELLQIEQQVTDLLEQKYRLGQAIFEQFYDDIQNAEEEGKQKTASEAPMTDLEFWGRMSVLNPKLFSQLEPRFEELEKFVIAHKLRHNQDSDKTTSQKVIADLLSKKEKTATDENGDSKQENKEEQ